MTRSEWISLAVAIGTLGLAVTAAWQIIAARWSRPKLSLQVDEEGIHTRIETGHPWIRLIVGNAKRRRAATGVRVLVQWYKQTDSLADAVSLAGPELGWPSTSLRAGDGAVVFGGTARPLDFGALSTGPIDAHELAQMLGSQDPLPNGYQWWFRFTLSMHGRDLFIGREFLPPVSGGYTARLVVGADEGMARTFDVQFRWIGDAPDADSALESFLISVHPEARGVNSKRRVQK